MNAIVMFKADNDKNETAIENFEESYPEFDIKHIVTDIDPNYDVAIAFYGEIDEDHVNDIIRLTHHAEAIYEDTSFEYVHVEVCIGDERYGVCA